MNYDIEITALFEKQLKRLSRKFPSLKKEYANLVSMLKQEPKSGTALGNNCYKVRIAIASKGKGKSGGGRVITHVKVTKTKVYLLSIYDKSEQSTITDADINELVKML
jgi:mRNA-degrading endonuclease RelE of RelBE toxin-antitoxin system